MKLTLIDHAGLTSNMNFQNIFPESQPKWLIYQLCCTEPLEYSNTHQILRTTFSSISEAELRFNEISSRFCLPQKCFWNTIRKLMKIPKTKGKIGNDLYLFHLTAIL